MNRKLRWGILGTGRIAHTFARHLTASDNGYLAAAASRSEGSAAAFAGEFGVKAFASYESMLTASDIDAVYISTPHPFHSGWAIEAAKAGKHILCEKPMAMNYDEAKSMVGAASDNKVFFMEGFMYRCHPQTARLVQLLNEGAVGEVRVIQISFGFNGGFDPQGRLMNRSLGGGGILDVGCYCTSMARLLAGAAVGKGSQEPAGVTGLGQIGGVTGVDEWALASLKFDGGILAQLATGIRVDLDNDVKVYGSKGMLVVPSPWLPGNNGGNGLIRIRKTGSSDFEDIEIENGKPLYALEADAVYEHLLEQQAPQMPWDDSLGNARTLDMWLDSIGMDYKPL